LTLEPQVPPERAAQLAAVGHSVERAPLLGICAAIHRQAATDELTATLDPRFSFE
jgi:hypothetical protein